MAEQYDRMMDIEVRTLIEMGRKDVLPAMSAEFDFYAEAASKAKKCPKFFETRMEQLSELIDNTYSATEKMTTLWKEANETGDDFECGKKIYYTVVPAMLELRKYIDRYEQIASRNFYKLPLYEEMLFDFD